VDFAGRVGTSQGRAGTAAPRVAGERSPVSGLAHSSAAVVETSRGAPQAPRGGTGRSRRSQPLRRSRLAANPRRASARRGPDRRGVAWLATYPMTQTPAQLARASASASKLSVRESRTLPTAANVASAAAPMMAPRASSRVCSRPSFFSSRLRLATRIAGNPRNTPPARAPATSVTIPARAEVSAPNTNLAASSLDRNPRSFPSCKKGKVDAGRARSPAWTEAGRAVNAEHRHRERPRPQTRPQARSVTPGAP
jgi:hypothetical protein